VFFHPEDLKIKIGTPSVCKWQGADRNQNISKRKSPSVLIPSLLSTLSLSILLLLGISGILWQGSRSGVPRSPRLALPAPSLPQVALPSPRSIFYQPNRDQKISLFTHATSMLCILQCNGSPIKVADTLFQIPWHSSIAWLSERTACSVRF